MYVLFNTDAAFYITMCECIYNTCNDLLFASKNILHYFNIFTIVKLKLV